MEIKRTVFFIVMDTLSICLAFFITSSFLSIPHLYLYEVISIILFVKLAFFASRGLYKITWRYVSIKDFYNLFLTTILASATLVVLFSLLNTKLDQFAYPSSYFVLDWMFSFLFMSGVRVVKRLYLEVLKMKQKGKGLRTLILGAGHTGEMILRDMMRHNYAHFSPVGFLDDDPSKVGAFLHGVKVLSSLQDFERVVADEQVEAVLIAMPTLHFPQLKKIYSLIKKNKNIKVVKTVPRIYDYDVPDFRLKDLEDISIEDLIGRQSVNVDRSLIRNFLEGKRVLITGAGGSIGSEISLQACSANLEKAIFLDVDETELHNLRLKFKQKFPHLFDRFYFVVGDVRDEKRIEEVFQTFSPQVVFHAAAYKHVPVMEDNAREAVKVNVFGTYHLASTAARYEVDKFILISTDKAVRPTSVMGATKRLAEQICKAVGSQARTKTKFIAVRFGNVLGSRGSVLPLFIEQIRSGGPITVTHHEMKRYFMTIPEAVSLVLQSSAVGNGNEVMVLDMGKSVVIMRLAEDLIRLQGLVPYKDIDIQVVGLRPGEKLFEEILTAEEGTIATKHDRIFVACEKQQYYFSDMKAILEKLQRAIEQQAPSGELQVKSLLRRHVSHYEGLNEGDPVAKASNCENVIPINI